MTLPAFTGDLTDAQDVAKYITSPTNQALASQAELIASLFTQVADKPNFYDDNSVPDSANKGDRWISDATGIEETCIESYTSATLDKESKWAISAGELAKDQVKLQANESQLNGALVDQTFTNVGNDGEITPADKILIEPYFNEAVNEKTGLDQSATFFSILSTLNYTSYAQNYSNLVTYVNTTLDLFGDMNSSTTVDPVVWAGEWTSFRQSRSLLRTDIGNRQIAISETLNGDINSLRQDVDNISDDGKITPQEKPQIQREWNDVIVQNKAKIDAQAVQYSLTSEAEYVNYVSAYNDLNTYLNTTLQLFANMSTTTILTDEGSNSVEFNQKFSNYYLAQANIDIKIDTYFEDKINGVESVVVDQINKLASDDVITGGAEKQQVLQVWKDIQVDYSRHQGDATLYSITIAGDLVNAYNALDTHLNTTLGLFTDMSTDTSIDSNVFYGFFDTYRVESDAFRETLNVTQNNVIGNISDDGIVSGGTEKRQLQKVWKDIQSEYQTLISSASIYTVAVTPEYTTAYNDLNTYLNTTLGVFDNLATDTPVNPSVFDSNFDEYRARAESFKQVVIQAQKDSVVTEPPDYNEVKTTLTNIAQDGVISAGAEKAKAIATWTAVQASHGQFVSMASTTGADITTLQAKYDQLDSFLSGLEGVPPDNGTPNFLITDQDTAVGASSFFSNFEQYYVARDDLQRVMMENLQKGLEETAQGILDINNDGIVTKQEKSILYQDNVQYTSEVANLNTQADSLSIVTEKNAMNTAWTTLQNFLNGMDGGAGLFNDLSSNTVLTTTENNEWDGKWSDFFTTKTALETAIITTQSANHVSLNNAVMYRDGSRSMQGDLNMETSGTKYHINGIKERAPISGESYAATTNQVYGLQQQDIILQNNINQEVIDRNNAIQAESTAIKDQILNGAGTAFDTLQELIDAIGISDEETPLVTDLLTQIGNAQTSANNAQSTADGKVGLTGNETIAGDKTFSGGITASGSLEVPTGQRIFVDEDARIVYRDGGVTKFQIDYSPGGTGGQLFISTSDSNNVLFKVDADGVVWGKSFQILT